jgi:hypothetical protein
MDETIRALRAIVSGYHPAIHDERYIVVENPDFEEDNGENPNLVIDFEEFKNGNSRYNGNG